MKQILTIVLFCFISISFSFAQNNLLTELETEIPTEIKYQLPAFKTLKIGNLQFLVLMKPIPKYNYYIVFLMEYNLALVESLFIKLMLQH